MSPQISAAEAAAAPPAQAALLGQAAAGPRARSLAMAVGALLLAAFAVTAPFAARPLPILDGFVPTYDAVVATLDAVAAVLLYGQYRSLGERSFLALGAGSLFNAVMALAHGMSFPGAFVDGPLIGGTQTTPWMWLAWHGVFPAFAVAYGLTGRAERARTPQRGSAGPSPGAYGPAVLSSLATLALAGVLISLAVRADELLPPLMRAGAYRSDAIRLAMSGAALVHLVALGVVLWSTGARRIVDLWVGLVLVVLLIELALCGPLVTGRFQVGFYAGRIYGALGAGAVLALLLREAAFLHAETARSLQALHASQSREKLLLDELQRRVQSNMAMLRAVVRRSMTGASADARGLGAELEGRIEALARSQSLAALSMARGGADLEALIRDELVAQDADVRRVVLSGPSVRLGARAAEVLALALHELASNAARYGALAQADGRLLVAWRLTETAAGARVELTWNETNVAVPAEARGPSGFGVEMITEHLPYELDGEARIQLHPDGVSCQIAFPIQAVTARLRSRGRERS